MGKLGLSLVLVTSLAFADKEPPPPAAKPKPVPAAKSVKQMSRAELEAEVENLRADNAKLRQQNESLLAQEKARAERLQKSLGSPAAKDLK